MRRTLPEYLIRLWSIQRGGKDEPPDVWDFVTPLDAERVLGGEPGLLVFVGEEENARVFALVGREAYLLQVVLTEASPRLQVEHLGALEGGTYIEEIGIDDTVIRFTHDRLPGPVEHGFRPSDAVTNEGLRATLRSWGEATPP
jgi:hypothetical protein